MNFTVTNLRHVEHPQVDAVCDIAIGDALLVRGVLLTTDYFIGRPTAVAPHVDGRPVIVWTGPERHAIGAAIAHQLRRDAESLTPPRGYQTVPPDSAPSGAAGSDGGVS